MSDIGINRDVQLDDGHHRRLQSRWIADRSDTAALDMVMVNHSFASLTMRVIPLYWVQKFYPDTRPVRSTVEKNREQPVFFFRVRQVL
jgi:hypothetical protein